MNKANRPAAGWQAAASLDAIGALVYAPSSLRRARLERVARCFIFREGLPPIVPVSLMKVKNSLKSLKGRHRANRLVRRRGRVYIINKVNPRYKARQG